MRLAGLRAGLVVCAIAFSTPVWAADRLPDGGTARATGSGIVEAWYEQPTNRYDHGILGDAVEAGALVGIDGSGKRHELVLPERYVFEDITPRLADLDGDGASEIIAIRTDLGAGAAVAVYGLIDGELVERAATAPIGLTHRWLSIAAIADFSSEPGLEIAIVKTPHIGGRLELLSLQGPGLVALGAALTGVSTHFIGSRDLSLADSRDTDGDGYAELALPSQNRRQVIVVTFVPNTRVIHTLDTATQITTPITKAMWD